MDLYCHPDFKVNEHVVVMVVVVMVVGAMDVVVEVVVEEGLVAVAAFGKETAW